MRTITIDIIDEKALNLLRDMELLQLIRLRKDKTSQKPAPTKWTKYKGAMSKQPLSDIDKQLNELRNEWE